MICEREDLGHPATHGPIKGQDLSGSGERMLRFWCQGTMERGLHAQALESAFE